MASASRRAVIGRLLNSHVYELMQELKDCKTILDLGCGSSSPIGGLRAFSANVNLVGVDAFAHSIESSRRKGIHNEYFLMNVLDVEDKFGRKSFDCVVALDLIEHLQKKEGNRLLEMMEKVARKKVVINTPNGFLAQRAYNGNVSQIHRSGWTTWEMRARGYRVVGVNGWKPLKGGVWQANYLARKAWRMDLQFDHTICEAQTRKGI